MQEFLRKFTQLDGKMGKVTLDHCLFGKQVFYCNELQTINNDEKVGVIIKEREIFVDRHDIKTTEICGNVYKISDSRLTIIVDLNK